MGEVTGIGGIFIRSEDPRKLADWYRERLGVPVNESGYCDFEWRSAKEPERIGRTVWSVFPADTEYFGDERSPFMVNYRVDDLDGLLESLQESGANVDDRLEEFDYGRFAWLTDPEGKRIELWEPAGEETGDDPGHTFLFTEGTWRAEGRIVLDDGTWKPASGVTTIRHRLEEWVVEGEMRVDSGDGEERMENVYRVRPFSEDDAFTTWTSHNPGLGDLTGSFSIVGDAILSVYQGSDGVGTGTECIRRLTPDVYLVRGTLAGGGERISSWDMTLRRSDASG
ncbi:MAG: VOC family protein [Candidatus Palauibacterales bacterium]|nr:VOC family protein [Candidatus Palauibacterales bacterium]